MYMVHVARAKAFLLIMIIIVCATSCENKKAPLPQHRYYYYPKTNIYFDAKSLEYIYSLDSARTWVKMKVAGQEPALALGDKIAIKETSDDIWYENETHRNMYGGGLYNVITKDTALLTEKPKEVKKPASKQETEPESKKKRNIFQKIFGKKKN